MAVYTRTNVLKMERVTEGLTAKADGASEVDWRDIMQQSRVQKADVTKRCGAQSTRLSAKKLAGGCGGGSLRLRAATANGRCAVN